MWVEINTRINYPIKEILLRMVDDGDLNMDDPLHQFCSSWFTINVSSVGIKTFLHSWNHHPIPGVLPYFALMLEEV